MIDSALLTGLGNAVNALRAAGRDYALAGGLAVAVRGEPRFTRDVDLVVVTTGDPDMEDLVSGLRGRGYQIVALVEHEARARLATARLMAPSGGLIVDLIAASCGIEAEIVQRATLIELPALGRIPVARTEELLSMKVLSMTDRRPQDRMDALSLLRINDNMLDQDAIRANLRLIRERGFHRGQDLERKWVELLEAAQLA